MRAIALAIMFGSNLYAYYQTDGNPVVGTTAYTLAMATVFCILFGW